MARRVSLRMAVMIWVGLPAMIIGSSACAQAARDNQLLYELFNRLDQLEQEIRQLRGDLDLYRYRQEEAMQRQQQLYTDLDRRLQALEEQSGVAAPQVAGPEIPDMARQPEPDTALPPGQPASPPPALPSPASGTEQAAYEQAFNMLREGRYQQAISAFQAFLRDYPNSPLAGDAQYWLGETYYVTREFDRAREAFLALGSNYPEHDKIPDALLRLGYTFQELNERAKARQVLQQLIESYPQSRAAELAQQRLQQ